MNIQLRCPDCKGEIQVGCAPRLEQKLAECPSCHAKHKIGDFLPRFSLRVGQRNYQLRLGRQWVGRMREGNDAQVQIPDESMYMSKHHAIIEITLKANGPQITYEEHGKNPTQLQGVELVKDDIVYLSVNDCLQLGGQKMYLAAEYDNS